MDNLVKKKGILRSISDWGFIAFCWVTAIISVFVLCCVLFELIRNGISYLSLDLLLKDTRELGLRNAIIGSVILTFGSIIIAAPIAILTATFFIEFKEHSKLIKIVRFLNDMLLSTPSVIIGLFVYTIIVAHTHFSGYAGMVALALIALPMIVRSAEDVLYLVSPMLKEAAIALGIPKWKVIIFIIYKSAKTGLITSVVLATARVMGESAPLLFTSAKNSFISFNPGQPMETLPVMIFENAMQPYPKMQGVAWSAALIVTFLVLVMNLTARWCARSK